jgi:addiction module HigA family antidote
MSTRELPLIHPGEILLGEYLKPLRISPYRLAKDIKVAPQRINEILHSQQAITADTALRLARYFGTSEIFWLNLQARYELALRKLELGECLEQEVKALA